MKTSDCRLERNARGVVGLVIAPGMTEGQPWATIRKYASHDEVGRKESGPGQHAGRSESEVNHTGESESTGEAASSSGSRVDPVAGTAREAGPRIAANAFPFRLPRGSD